MSLDIRELIETYYFDYAWIKLIGDSCIRYIRFGLEASTTCFLLQNKLNILSTILHIEIIENITKIRKLT